MADNYKIRYIPHFEEELMGVVDYIASTLGNHSAAEDLIDEVERAIKKRSYAPLAFEPCRSSHDREHDYYRIYVKNYVIYYVVISDVMEVRRIVYNKRDRRQCGGIVD